MTFGTFGHTKVHFTYVPFSYKVTTIYFYEKLMRADGIFRLPAHEGLIFRASHSFLP